MIFSRANVYAFAALCLQLFVNGQVDVGSSGSFYNPAFISARAGDTIVFQFLEDVHTVTQSNFTNPCSPLPGGFNSGIVIGPGTNTSLPMPKWSLVITNDTGPIWYFCAATRPTSHCNSGMVGVINPPSIAMYSQFVNAARLVTGTPAPTPGVTLTGQGASATGSPTGTPISITSSPSSTSSSTSTSTTTPTQTAAATTSHLGAIVGGSVGGAVAVIVGLILILWIIKLRKQKKPIIREADDFFRYNPVPVRRPSEVFNEAKRVETLHHNASFTSNITNTNTNTNTNSSAPTNFSPLRRPLPMPSLAQPAPVRLEPAPSDLLLTPATSGYPQSEPPSNIDIRSLAQEVAAVLYSQKDSSSHGQQSMTVQNPSHAEDEYMNDTPQGSQPPPNYRATMGPSPAPDGKPRR